MTTQDAVEALTNPLGHDERRELAEALRRALDLLSGPSGPLDAGLRQRFEEAADLLAV